MRRALLCAVFAVSTIIHAQQSTQLFKAAVAVPAWTPMSFTNDATTGAFTLTPHSGSTGPAGCITKAAGNAGDMVECATYGIVPCQFDGPAKSGDVTTIAGAFCHDAGAGGQAAIDPTVGSPGGIAGARPDLGTNVYEVDFISPGRRGANDVKSVVQNSDGTSTVTMVSGATATLSVPTPNQISGFSAAVQVSQTPQVQTDWNAASGIAQVLNKPSLAPVATSGSYSSLAGLPIIPSTVTINSVSCMLNGSCTLPVGNSGTLTSFVAPSASWPSWLVPTVTSSTTAPSLAVAASAIPNAALANSGITVNGAPISLGGTVTTPQGTVTAVTATTPIVSSGGTAPALSCPTCLTTSSSYALPDLSGTGTLPALTLAVAGCTTAITISVPGAIVGHRVDVMNTDGTLPAANSYYNGSVTAANTVSAVQCATVGLAMTAKAITVWTR